MLLRLFALLLVRIPISMLIRTSRLAVRIFVMSVRGCRVVISVIVLRFAVRVVVWRVRLVVMRVLIVLMR